MRLRMRNIAVYKRGESLGGVSAFHLETPSGVNHELEDVSLSIEQCSMSRPIDL